MADKAFVRFASLDSAISAAARAVGRFPLTLVCAWVACAFFDVVILANGEGHDRLFYIGVVLTLGIPLCFALALLRERQPTASLAVRWLPQVGVLLALAVLAYLWPHWTGDIQWRRYFQLSLLAHALVAFLPYTTVREPNGFWQFNRTLLDRFILASIFSGVLLAGLEGALATLHPLFGIKVSGKAYGLLATWLAFGFHPWFFLAGIPADLAGLEERRDYPATVRVFAQLILVPLVAVYQALLTAYLVKVVITGDWPSGLIGWLVSAEAIAGILAILLVHPVRDLVENLWVRRFARGFYIALIPSIAMLAVSIAKRVGQYGVTEDRYFVIALTAWLGCIATFFIARRDGDIRWIPVTLALLALLTFGGPWGAYHVSLVSQRARFVRLLEQNGMWRHGKLEAPAREVPAAQRKQLSAALVYLLDHHGGKALVSVLGPTLAAADSGVKHPERSGGNVRAQLIASKLGFTFVGEYETVSDSLRAFFFNQEYVTRPAASPVDGLEYHVDVDYTGKAFHVGSRSLVLWCDDAGRRLLLVDDLGHEGRLPPMPPLDTLATAPLAPLVAAARATWAPDRPLPRVRF